MTRTGNGDVHEQVTGRRVTCKYGDGHGREVALRCPSFRVLLRVLTGLTLEP